MADYDAVRSNEAPGVQGHLHKIYSNAKIPKKIRRQAAQKALAYTEKMPFNAYRVANLLRLAKSSDELTLYTPKFFDAAYETALRIPQDDTDHLTSLSLLASVPPDRFPQSAETANLLTAAIERLPAAEQTPRFIEEAKASAHNRDRFAAAAIAAADGLDDVARLHFFQNLKEDYDFPPALREKAATALKAQAQAEPNLSLIEARRPQRKRTAATVYCADDSNVLAFPSPQPTR